MAQEKKITIQRWQLDKPTQLSGMALTLKTHIVKNKLFTEISGKNYVHVEGWQFAGGLLGLSPQVRIVKDLSNDKELKWMVEVEIVRMKDERIMSRGFAICSNKETKKKNFDEYAVLSMAQTRAIGKAYRNLLGWVMKLAGYEGTPSEEMKKVDENGANVAKESVQQSLLVAKKGIFRCCKIGCKTLASKSEHDYSMQFFKKSLCREHQKEAKK